ncbi:uncharacterized protein H6S33_005979 [Morchella sextelata]|uniref:uncharacterized protein n=1 Tax=Morchella sextelata TaxID=1174677 RepID=UPI001D050FC1|nr:uncharacterized protein H6S33_005979 [Morchella sextelata]KAH0614093.1 hypothetical protein H6S33_005979 [Morchella sextelata]
MRYTYHIPAALLALPSLVAASFSCQATPGGNVKFDFSPLKGAHSITMGPKDDYPFVRNITWTINPCGPIGKEKHIPAKEQCPAGTQVCGIERIGQEGDETPLVAVIPIAGDIEGRHTDEVVERLKTSTAPTDQGKEGLRVVLHGGLYNNAKQQAIVDFICDPDKTGLEGDEPDETEPEEAGKTEGVARRSPEEDKGGDKEKKDRSLKYVSYESVEGKHTLRLEWKTKYACETATGGDGSPDSGSGWGFFTWFIIILFLGIAAYLIFGSWLNYNRYGARGWDLLPHGDTIRDVPYLLKEWCRRVIGTLQRGGGRGGYSAV